MSASEEAWGAVAEHLRTLGSLVMERASGDPNDVESSLRVPTDEEFKEAVRVIGDRASATLGALTESIRDPEVRSEAELATSAFLNALGVSFSEVGAQLVDLATRSGDQEPTESGTWEPDEADLDG